MIAPRTRRITSSAKGCRRLRKSTGPFSSQFSVLRKIPAQFRVVSSAFGWNIDFFLRTEPALPCRIGLAVASHLLRAAVDADDAAFLFLIERHDEILTGFGLPGIGAARDVKIGR